MRHSVFAALFGAVLAAPCMVHADAALILVESDYAQLSDVPGANQASALAQLAENAGFDVTASLDQSASDASRAVAQFRQAAEDGERVMILVSGHVLSDGSNTWLLTRFAEDVTRFNVGAMAVPLGPLMEIAAEFPGQAVVMIAASGDDVGAEGLTPIGTIDAAQGVTVISGSLSSLTRMTRENLLVPGLTLREVIDEAPRGVDGSGYISDATSFLPGDGGQRVVIERTEQSPEDAFWVVAKTMENKAGYDLYLQYFPQGTHNAEARANLRQIESNSQNSAEVDEAKLALNQAAKRQVQRNLAILGHDPRGIDGIFGPGTRAAITSYQRANGFTPTGYLTREMLAQMTPRADARAVELERQAEIRKLEEERRDRAYWTATGSEGDEPGLRAYLDRYPDGLFADVAQERLDQIEAQKRNQAQAAERSFWDSVRATDTAEGYTSYLTRYPSGLFAEDAKARLREMQAESQQEAGQEAAVAEEGSVAGNPVTRLLVETKLNSLGFNLSSVDGDFDKSTRRAIRRFQRERDLPVTGYVSQDTMVRLLAAF